MSHRRTLRSCPPADATSLSSGLQATARTPRSWPKVGLFSPPGISQERIVLSTLALKMVRLSGLKATELIQSLWPRKLCNSLALVASQSFTTWSLPPDARYLPLGLKATELTGPVCPEKSVGFPLASVMFHIVIVGFSPQAAKSRPSWLKARPLTTSLTRYDDPFSLPVVRSQSRTVMSLPAEARVFPSELAARAVTTPLWPLSVCVSFPASTSQIFTRRSAPPETICFPEVKMTLVTVFAWPSRVRISMP